MSYSDTTTKNKWYEFTFEGWGAVAAILAIVAIGATSAAFALHSETDSQINEKKKVKSQKYQLYVRYMELEKRDIELEDALAKKGITVK